MRWRDDDGESGTLADFEKTPQKFDQSPAKSSPEKSLPPVPAIPLYLTNNNGSDEKVDNNNKATDSADDSTVSLVVPETSALAASKPNRFQAGFLSKTRASTATASNGSPVAPTMSLSLSPEEKPSPLRNLDVAKTANGGSPRMATRLTSVSPRPARASPSQIPAPPSMFSSAPTSHATTATASAGDENHPPSSSEDSETSIIDTSKLRSALHASKRRDRLSSLARPSIGGPSSGIPPAINPNVTGLKPGGRRVSSIEYVPRSGSGLGGPSPPSSHHFGPLASATNGISRLRRGSAERRRSPPISCSPPELHGGAATLTPGQARRMGLGLGSLPRPLTGSPGESSSSSAAYRPRDRVVSAGGDLGKARRITIGGAAIASSGSSVSAPAVAAGAGVGAAPTAGAGAGVTAGPLGPTGAAKRGAAVTWR